MKFLGLILLIGHLTTPSKEIQIMQKNITSDSSMVYLYVERDSLPGILTDNLIYKYADIVSRKNYINNVSQSMKLFGKSHVIAGKLKSGLSILNKEQLLTKYKIKFSDKEIPLYVDGVKNKHPETILFVESTVIDVVIKKDDNGKDYINILTNMPQRPKGQMVNQ